MALEIQTRKITVGQSSTFTFSYAIQEYLVGIQYFRLSYGSTDHWLKKMSIALNQSQSGSTVITVQVVGCLNDSSGNTIDTSDSSVTVVVVAWTGTADHTLLLTNGDSNTAFTLPSSSVTILEAVLAGFDLEYGNDHYIAQVGVSAINVNHSGTTATLSASEIMTDRNGNSASTATFNAGLIASSGNSPGFEIQVSTLYNNTSQAVKFNAKWTYFVPIMTGFYVEYQNNEGHWLKDIEVYVYWGSDGLVHGISSMCDNSGNVQSSVGSFVNCIVVGY